MLHHDALGLLVGALVLGAVHGIEPGHGWPVAATYALDQTNKWLYGLAASFILGIGHLFSSIVMVLMFFYAKRYFSLTQVDQPIQLVGAVSLGGPVSLVAGLLLIVLGIREYRHGNGDGGYGGAINYQRDHAHGGHHTPGHDPRQARGGHPEGSPSRLKGRLPFVGEGHAHAEGQFEEAANRGLLGIAWFAFLLGFAHEEEFEIIGLCAGSVICLELMLAYAIAVIVGIVGLTLLLIAGYEHYQERVERYTPHLQAFSAAVLILMGAGFVAGLL